MSLYVYVHGRLNEALNNTFIKLRIFCTAWQIFVLYIMDSLTKLSKYSTTDNVLYHKKFPAILRGLIANDRELNYLRMNYRYENITLLHYLYIHRMPCSYEL